MKNKHRVVKIDFSVLEEFLNIIINADGTYQYDPYDYFNDFEIRFSIPKYLKKKAKNILENS